MKTIRLLILVLFALLFISSLSIAQVEIDENGNTKQAPVRKVDRYIGKKPSESREIASGASIGEDTHFLAIHLGTFVDDVSYKWGGSGKRDDVGSLSAGVSYRVGEWVNSMDLLFRADFNSYKVTDDRAVKMSLLPLVLFPDAASEFPLYFGVGAGLGIFFKQLDGESSLSFDYQLVAGVRLFNLIDSMGFFVESGMKNHIHLLSDGQFNGVFLTVGSVFLF